MKTDWTVICLVKVPQNQQSERISFADSKLQYSQFIQSKVSFGFLVKLAVSTGPSALIRPILSGTLFSICCPQNR